MSQRVSRSLPRETTRCSRLFGRSATARETWLQQPAFLDILNHFLRTEFVIHHDEQDPSKNVVLKTDAILSAAATLDIGSGVKAQGLHRDDFIWQQTHGAASEGVYEKGRDVAMGLLVPGVPTSKENGATRVRAVLTRKFFANRSPLTVRTPSSYPAPTYGSRTDNLRWRSCSRRRWKWAKLSFSSVLHCMVEVRTRRIVAGQCMGFSSAGHGCGQRLVSPISSHRGRWEYICSLSANY